MNATSSRRITPRDAVWAVAVLAVSAGAWFAWMGWDDEYWIDPETGAPQGPYEAWQVVGCVLTLLVIGVVAAWFWKPWGMAVLVTIGFTVAWSITAAPDDDSGMWGVGAIMILVGLGLAASVAAAIVTALRDRFAARRRSRG